MPVKPACQVGVGPRQAGSVVSACRRSRTSVTQARSRHGHPIANSTRARQPFRQALNSAVGRAAASMPPGARPAQLLPRPPLPAHLPQEHPSQGREAFRHPTTPPGPASSSAPTRPPGLPPSGPAPTSVMGVSRTRRGPYFCSRPRVILYAPWYSATSSPMMNTLSSRAISSSMAAGTQGARRGASASAAEERRGAAHPGPGAGRGQQLGAESRRTEHKVNMSAASRVWQLCWQADWRRACRALRLLGHPAAAHRLACTH